MSYRGPQTIGDIIELEVTWRAPAGSGNVVSAANLLVRGPDGTENVSSGDEVSANVWHFIAADPINLWGKWVIRVNAIGGLIHSIEFPIYIPRTRFDEPLAVP